MRRLLWSLGLASLLVAQLAGPVEAQRKAKAKGRSKEKAAPMSPQIEQDLGDVEWGMTMQQVLDKFTKEIEEKYRPQIAKVHSAIKEDQLRAKMRGEIKKLHDSAVRFDGKKTGWDVSFLKGEFTHNNNESLLVVEDKNSKNFYFFIRDRLWKQYKAFDQRVFRGADFEKFSGAVEGRYGDAAEREGEAPPGAGKRQYLEWQDKQTRLRAIDQTNFYGFYCLVFEDKATLRRLPELRRNKGRDSGEMNSFVEQVTSGDEAGTGSDSDVADRITGRLRRKTNAPKASGSSASRSSSGRSEEAPPPPPQGVSDEDDPLRGLF